MPGEYLGTEVDSFLASREKVDPRKLDREVKVTIITGRPARLEWDPKKSSVLKRMSDQEKLKVKAALSGLLNSQEIVVIEKESENPLEDLREALVSQLAGLIRRAIKVEKLKVKGPQPVEIDSKPPKVRKREDEKRHVGGIKAGRQHRWGQMVNED